MVSSLLNFLLSITRQSPYDCVLGFAMHESLENHLILGTLIGWQFQNPSSKCIGLGLHCEGNVSGNTRSDVIKPTMKSFVHHQKNHQKTSHRFQKRFLPNSARRSQDAVKNNGRKLDLLKTHFFRSSKNWGGPLCDPPPLHNGPLFFQYHTS